MKKKIAAALVASLILVSACSGETGVTTTTDPAGTSIETSTETSKTSTEGEKTSTETSTEASTETSTEASAETKQDLTWNYVLSGDVIEAESKLENGTIIARVSQEYPILLATCAEDPTATVPADIQKNLDTFNAGISAYINSGDSLESLATEAKLVYDNRDEDGKKNFPPFVYETTVLSQEIVGDLVEVNIERYINRGGAHGGSSLLNLHFDLKDGEFFEFRDLTDESSELWEDAADAILEYIYTYKNVDEYYTNFYELIRDKIDPNFSIGPNGITVSFDEYEIAPYAVGMPTFFVGYEHLINGLNEKGLRLLRPDTKAKILADYYDATDYWYWFEGAAPVDYEDSIDDGPYFYCAFDYPGITTMDELTNFLKSCFSDDLVENRMSRGLFKEFNGKLYAAAAGRGTDITIHHVDYTVNYEEGASEGTIGVAIYRQDFAEDGDYKPILTGEVDNLEVSFKVTDTGVVFTTFVTIW